VRSSAAILSILAAAAPEGLAPSLTAHTAADAVVVGRVRKADLLPACLGHGWLTEWRIGWLSPQ